MGSGFSSKLRKRNKQTQKDRVQEESDSRNNVRLLTHEIPTLKVVEEAWKEIASQEVMNFHGGNVISNDIGWRDIRIFVSSTFSDMHSEREILVKKVFPELRDWCEERRFTLIECDMRWGIPKDTASTATISVCLEEIDRCFEENHRKPYFINMLSERYGWIPSEAEVSDEVKEKYQWVKNVSITHMEIIHGAYRTNNPNALFCLRDPKFISDLPQQHLSKFVETDELPKLHLKVLKEKLKKKFKDRCITYGCLVSGIDQSTGRDKVVLVKLIGLEDFGQKVLNFLKNAILKQYPCNQMGQKLNDEDQEEDIHQRNASIYSSFVIGRTEELDAIKSYIEKGVINKLFKSEQNDEDTLKTDFGMEDNKILCISGLPGIGKSSILCKSARMHEEMGIKIIFHYTGCTINSRDWIYTIKRIIRNIDPTVIPESESTGHENESSLMERMKQVLEKCSTRVILFICKLENMYNSDSVNCLDWLPPRFPEKVKCVISVDCDNYVCMSRLRDKQCHFIKLENFSMTEASNFVQQYLLKYNKKLDGDQMKNLLTKGSSTFPLWLKVASEELRVFGDFSTLSNKINLLADNLKDLIKDVVNRLVAEDETLLMEKFLCLMLCSQSGLPESEISKLLGDPGEGKESPPIVWATIRRHLKPFIVQTKFYRTSKVHFLHKTFTQAAEELIINDENRKKWNKYLADYFEYHNKDEIYVFDDLSHNLFHSGEWKRLATFYRADRRTFTMNTFLRSQLLCKIRCTSAGPNYKVVVCLPCSLRGQLISCFGGATKDLCYLCGMRVPFKNDNNIAHVCTRHSRSVHNMFKCFNCNVMITGTNVTCMHLCNLCTIGNRCSQLLEGNFI